MISQVAMVKAVVHASDATAPDRGGVVSQANLRHSNRRPEPIREPSRSAAYKRERSYTRRRRGV